jgi:hypothetical protein
METYILMRQLKVISGKVLNNVKRQTPHPEKANNFLTQPVSDTIKLAIPTRQ